MQNSFPGGWRMVDDPVRWAEALKRVDALALDDDRLKTLQVLAKRKGWNPKKTVAVGEDLRNRLPAMTGSEQDYIPELERLIEEAGRDYDRYMAKQALTKLRGNKKPKFH